MDLDTILSKETSLEALGKAFPKQWQEVSPKVIPVINRHNPAEMEAFLRSADQQTRHWQKRYNQSQQNPKVLKAAIPKIAKARMCRLALEKYFDAVLQKDTSSHRAENLWDRLLLKYCLGFHVIAQRSYSIAYLNFIWRFVRNKRRAVGELKKLGQYTVFSKDFLKKIAAEVSGAEVLELAAGSGELTRKLKCHGVSIKAVDDGSWEHVLERGDFVENISAQSALQKFSGSIVLCAWPPPQNSFEKIIFTCSPVKTYIVIGSKLAAATGDRHAYAKQKTFIAKRRQDLECLLFPKEHEYEVLEFSRQ